MLNQCPSRPYRYNSGRAIRTSSSRDWDKFQPNHDSAGLHTDDTVEQTDGDGRRDRPERVPPQKEGVLENTERRCSAKEKKNNRLVDALL